MMMVMVMMMMMMKGIKFVATSSVMSLYETGLNIRNPPTHQASRKNMVFPQKNENFNRLPPRNSTSQLSSNPNLLMNISAKMFKVNNFVI